MEAVGIAGYNNCHLVNPVLYFIFRVNALNRPWSNNAASSE